MGRQSGILPPAPLGLQEPPGSRTALELEHLSKLHG